MQKRLDYAKYLRSDHWRAMREAKRAACPRVTCESCGSSDRLDLHHLVYRNLTDVTIADLRWVCRVCHDRIHAMMTLQLLVYRSDDPADRWAATLAALGGLPDPFKGRAKRISRRMRARRKG
jgi:hypothetical protein